MHKLENWDKIDENVYNYTISPRLWYSIYINENGEASLYINGIILSGDDDIDVEDERIFTGSLDECLQAAYNDHSGGEINA